MDNFKKKEGERKKDPQVSFEGPDGEMIMPPVFLEDWEVSKYILDDPPVTHTVECVPVDRVLLVNKPKFEKHMQEKDVKVRRRERMVMERITRQDETRTNASPADVKIEGTDNFSTPKARVMPWDAATTLQPSYEKNAPGTPLRDRKEVTEEDAPWNEDWVYKPTPASFTIETKTSVTLPWPETEAQWPSPANQKPPANAKPPPFPAVTAEKKS